MKALGVILAGGKSEQMKELTSERALAAMPIAGSYKAIDFTLSNMANSGINKVAVVAQYNSRSLVEHLSSSKWWDFGRKHGGLFLFTPFISRDNSMWYRGTADAIYQNINFLKESHEPYVVITSGDCICKLDFNKILEYHVTRHADITIVCKKLENEDLCRFGVVQLNDDYRVIEFEEKPIVPIGNIISTGIYIIRRRLLIELLENCAKEERHDIVNDIIIRYRKKKKIYAYLFEGYWKNISTIRSYYDTNMDFLRSACRELFFRTEPTIMSKVHDDPPAKFNFGAKIQNSLSSSGCIINGTIKRSIIFGKVFVGTNSLIKNSIILNGTYVGNNCIIENCIVDSKCHITNGSILKGNENKIKIIKKRVPFYI